MKAIKHASELWDSRSLNVMLIGRHTTGRHTLARSLFGEEVDTECSGTYVCNVCKNDVPVKLNFWRPSESNNPDFDLAIYTIQRGHLTEEDKKILQQLSRTFTNIAKWNKTIFALTFANRMTDYDKDYPSKKLVLEKKKQFQKDVKDFIINDDTDLNIPPVVPVGHIDESETLFEEDEEPWRSHLVKCILARVKSYDAVGGIWKALNEYVQHPETVGIWWRIFQSVIHYIHTYIYPIPYKIPETVTCHL